MGWAGAEAVILVGCYTVISSQSFGRSACSVMVNKRTKSINNALRATALTAAIARCQ